MKCPRFATWLMAGLACAVQAATVQVQVLQGANQPLEQAVVFLESAAARRAVRPQTGLEIAQEHKQFLPDVLIVPVGSQVQFPNRDTVRHHVYSFSAAKKFELKLYTGTPASPVLFDQPGVVVLGCNIHDSMVGWLLVVDTPYYGQTSAVGGAVQLNDVPAGNYRLRVWHSRLPVGAAAHDQALSVPVTGTVQVQVQLLGLLP